MFFFYHTSQTESNKSYYKGLLFEQLLAKHLDHCGYDVKIRRKRNSLEYDLEGEDRTSKLNIIGEAKALNNTISGKVFSSFVGKLTALGLIEKEIRGLFLSISSLTPEADDFYNKIKRYGVITHTGKELHDAIHSSFKLPHFNTLSRRLEDQGFIPQTGSILVTDIGIFACAPAPRILG